MPEADTNSRTARVNELQKLFLAGQLVGYSTTRFGGLELIPHMLFSIFLAIDLIVAAVVVYFFCVGLQDGSITSFNGKLWMVTLVALGCVVFGGLALRNRGWTRLASTLLAILALPAIGYGIFMLSLVLTVDRWNSQQGL